MKKAIKLSVIAATLGVVAACGNAESNSAPVTLKTDADKESYALGASMGGYLKANIENNTKIGVELNTDVILSGINEALAGNSQMTDEEIKEVMMALETRVRKLRSEQASVPGKKFLEENAKRPEVTVTESGLQFEVLTEAEGAKPVATDTVEVHYHGTLIDGTVFDSSVERGETISFALNRVIPGWTEGVQKMSVGSKYKFYIPSELGYGARAAGKIPPFSTLIFEVELFDIKKNDQ